MYLSSFFIYALQVFNGVLLYIFGNYFLDIPQWSTFSSLQYTGVLIASFSWVGTDLSGIRIIADSNKKERGSDFISIIILRNLVFLIFFLVFCPILVNKFSLPVFLYGVGMVNIPTFYFFGEKKRFGTYIVSEIIQKFFLGLILFYSVQLNIYFLNVFFLIAGLYCLSSIILFFLILSKESYSLELIKNNLLSAKEKYFRTGIVYIFLSMTQQVIATLPVILFQRLGLHSIAVELTNLERIVRILRELVGQVSKVLLGKIGNYFKETQFLKFFLGCNIIFIFLCFLLSDILLFVPNYLKFDLINLSLYMITIPIASYSTFLLVTKFRDGIFSNKNIFIIGLRLVLCIAGLASIATLFQSFYGIIYYMIFLELWLLYILHSTTMRIQ